MFEGSLDYSEKPGFKKPKESRGEADLGKMLSLQGGVGSSTSSLVKSHASNPSVGKQRQKDH